MEEGLHEGRKRMQLGKHDWQDMQSIFVMVMAVDDGNIDSEDNFHNDDSIMTVDAVMMIPKSCVHVTGVKCNNYVKVQ